jgi:hypothetical protein
LIPDQSDSIIIAGRGSFSNIDYACAAITPDNNTFLVYLPTSRTLTIDIKKISGKKLKASWYNPRTGEISLVDPIQDKRMTDFTPVSNGDWLLIIENASLQTQ